MINAASEKAWSGFWPNTEDDGYQTVTVNVEHPTEATRLAIESFLEANKPGIVAHIFSIGDLPY